MTETTNQDRWIEWAKILLPIVAAIITGVISATISLRETRQLMAQQEAANKRDNCLVASTFLNISDVEEAREFGLKLMETACQDFIDSNFESELTTDDRNAIISGESDLTVLEDTNGNEGFYIVPKAERSTESPTLVAPIRNNAIFNAESFVQP